MIINMASTSAYDENEVQLEVVAEKGEIIKIGDIITIPMNTTLLSSVRLQICIETGKEAKIYFLK